MQLDDADETRPARRVRWAWLALGHGAFALGFTGMFLPLLPTVALWILAAWAYTRASPELRHRLQTHPKFGPAIVAWQQHGQVARRGKVAAVLAMAASFAIAVWSGAAAWVLWLIAAILLAVAAFILSRPEPRGP